jgi:hypothetical protein
MRRWTFCLLAIAVLACGKTTFAALFVHPGGLHTQADLERMRTNVLAGNHPWVDDWQQLLRDPQAQSDWKSAARANMGDSRQRADADAHAAYLNALRCLKSLSNKSFCPFRFWRRQIILGEPPFHHENTPALFSGPQLTMRGLSP